MQIVLATKNQGKLREIQARMADTGIDVGTAEELGLGKEVSEDGATFEENAVKKASEISELCGRLVVAEDAGLMIDFFGGAPGVYSSRWLGEDTPYEYKNNVVLGLMEGVPDSERTARYVSVFAAVFPDGRILTAKGVMEGVIGREAAGDGGFGYDPIFYLPETGQSVAQMPLDEKNEISHRGKALRLMKEKLLDAVKERGI